MIFFLLFTVRTDVENSPLYDNCVVHNKQLKILKTCNDTYDSTNTRFSDARKSREELTISRDNEEKRIKQADIENDQKVRDQAYESMKRLDDELEDIFKKIIWFDFAA